MSAARPALERRSERRIALRLALRVRGADREGLRFEERAESKNLCRGGAAFATTQALLPGADVEITITMPKQGREPETEFATRGHVAHVAPGREKGIRIVGVAFTGPRFPRELVSESTA